VNRQIRLLLVGDEAAFTRSIVAALESERDGFAVTVESTANEGLARLRADAPDCVVSAYGLPERDGVGFLEAVREEHPELPFVLACHRNSHTRFAAVPPGVKISVYV
jgi:DNA-binding NarL/FixJ family response regulator